LATESEQRVRENRHVRQRVDRYSECVCLKALAGADKDNYSKRGSEA